MSLHPTPIGAIPENRACRAGRCPNGSPTDAAAHSVRSTTMETFPALFLRLAAGSAPWRLAL